MITFILIIILLFVYSNLNNKIADLERKIDRNASSHAPWPSTPKSTVTEVRPQAPMHQTSTQMPAKMPVRTVAEAAPKVSEAVWMSEPVPIKKTEKEHAVQEEKPTNLEFKLGGKAFTAIGGVAIIIGIGFFLTYAFQTGLITESMRVVIGLFIGTVLISLGLYLSKKFTSYGQVLVGTGLGAFYISFYAAFSFYNLISEPAAFAFTIAVTVLGVVLSLRLDSLPLVTFASIGGFLIPAFFQTYSSDIHTLFIYIIILNLGILSIAKFKIWRPLSMGCFVATILTYMGWYLGSYNISLWVPAMFYAFIFFALYLGISLLNFMHKDSTADDTDFSLLTINPLIFFIISYNIVNPLHHEWMGMLTAAIGAIYVAVYFVVPSDSEKNERFKSFTLSIASLMFVIAVPIQFKKFNITIAWALEALVLTYLGLKNKLLNLRTAGQIVYSMVFIRLIVLDGLAYSGDAIVMPIWNVRVVTFIITIITFCLGALLYRKYRDEIKDDSIFSLLFMASSFAFLFGGTSEINTFFNHSFITFFWCIVALIITLAAFTFKDHYNRVFVVLLCLAIFGKLVFYDAYLFVDERVFLFLFAAISTIFIAAMYHMYKNTMTEDQLLTGQSLMLLEAYVLVQWLVTIQVTDFYAQSQYWMPIMWSVVAVIAVIAGLHFKNTALRVAVYVTLVACFMHLFTIEMFVDIAAYQPVWNSRVGSVLSSVALATCVFWLVRLNSNVSESEKSLVQKSLFFGIHLLCLWLFSVEVLNYYDRKIIREQSLLDTSFSIDDISHIKSVRNVALSIAWIIYALMLLVVGIIRKSSLARISSILLFALVIFKVFLYDSASLNNYYRFVSFISLGVILLLSGYLYNRYKERLTSFISV